MGPGSFRLVLALAVFVSHVSSLEIGVPAVMCFFALSGYWVMTMFAEKYRHIGIGTYAISRYLRLWPTFAAAYGISLLVLLLTGALADHASISSLLILGLATHGRDATGVSWSLDIELQFYLLVPLLWLAASRLGRPAPGRILVMTALSIGVSALGIALYATTGLRSVAIYAPAFLAGLAIWWLRPAVSARVALASVATFATVGAAAALWPTTPGLLQKDPSVSLMHRQVFSLVWAAFLVPFIAWNVRQPSGWLDRHLGNLSFPFYVCHFAMITFTSDALFPGEFGPAGKAVALGLSMVAALVLYVVVDRPADRLRATLIRHIADKRRQAALLPN